MKRPDTLYTVQVALCLTVTVLIVFTVGLMVGMFWAQDLGFISSPMGTNAGGTP